MSEVITTFVGLDVHKDSIAVAVAEQGRAAPRFIGTCGPALGEVLKTLSHLGKPRHMLVVYEAVPAVMGWCDPFETRAFVVRSSHRPRSPAAPATESRLTGATL